MSSSIKVDDNCVNEIVLTGHGSDLETMTQLVTEIYCSHGDGGERGIGPVIGYHTTSMKAEQHALGKGWYGGKGHVSTAHALVINGYYWLLGKETPVDIDGIQAMADIKLKEDTLASLTADQKRVLGIK